MIWFGQTGLNVNQFETSLSDSVNGAMMLWDESLLLVSSMQHHVLRVLKLVLDMVISGMIF